MINHLLERNLLPYLTLMLWFGLINSIYMLIYLIEENYTKGLSSQNNFLVR